MNIEKIDNTLRFNDCPLCHSVIIKKIGTISYPVPVAFSDSQITVQNQPEYWQCQSCDSYFVQNIISEAKAMELYSENKTNKWNYVDFEKDKTADFVNLIRGLIKENDNVLDIGCNDGNFLNFVKKISSHTFGVEFSQIGREACKKNGHQVFSNTTDVPAALKFDFIFAFDLVEHLYSIKDFLESSRRLLKDNGQLVILTGNPSCLSAGYAKSRWWYISNPEHIIFPSRKYFSDFSGFKIKEYRPIFNSRGFYLISLYNFWRITNVLKVIAKFILRRYNGVPLLGKDHALIILKHNKTK